MKSILKQTILTLALVLVGLGAAFAENNVPAPVLKAFASLHKNAEPYEWFGDGKTYFVCFEEGQQEGYAKFSSDGKLLEQGLMISEDDTPENTMMLFEDAFESGTITTVYKVTKTDKILLMGSDYTNRFLLYITKDGEKVKQETFPGPEEAELEQEFNDGGDF
ncbi:hypothetical protein V6R21_12675 [Limibacter armeniacum]|uniref:hypothetical protein n=1 Tax=Limibacter armeniacum TaxID=466084 RepID=UPI002FE6468A